ncbi:MAG: double-strand break repair protein AddB [Paracoccaceae bacterium]
MARVWSLPPGADFPAELVAGLRERMAGQPPEAMARVRLYVNTQRMRRRIVDLMSASGAGFLPRIRLVSELGDEVAIPGLPAPVPPLRRRLELTRLVGRLLDAQPDLAPKSALYDLADSLAALMDEMQGEGVPPARIAALDVSSHSAHWARTQAFLAIVAPFFGPDAPPDAEARRRMVVERLAEAWQADPPQDPVIVAGSTGSRGTTALFMQAVMRLPQGALILPGFDPMPGPAWRALDNALTAQDHPQFRFRHLLTLLDLTPDEVAPWRSAPPPDPARNRLISLSLRPAPVTDQWLAEGQDLPDLVEATTGLTLIEAPGPRAEALAIALVLRRAIEDGERAALITPDRVLTRQVAAALDRWGIVPDDSAGEPLQQTAAGRFLRQVVRMMGERLTPETLLALLKQPLAGTGGDRGDHLRFTRDLELHLRRHGPAFPDGASIMDWASRRKDGAATGWAAALAGALDRVEIGGEAPLADHVARHRALAEGFARGTGAAGTGALWQQEPGEKALALFDALAAEAEHGGSFTIAAYRDLFDALISRQEVRQTLEADPRVMIWGTLEARVSGADLVVLAGLNDGVWPGLANPDPWLNRQMRKEAGLLLPERQIGLAAHDYQQAVAAPRVVISRAARDAEAETVPSRWLNRLMNLMEGLPAKRGPQALAAMRDRGRGWLGLAAALERPGAAMRSDPRLTPAPRPAPRPPLAVRPMRLPLTRISTLIRDPYAIYAREVLRLKPLDPLRHAPDARGRGEVLHLILERFVKERPLSETMAEAHARLMAGAAEVLAAEVPWPAARILWLARLARAADHFLTFDATEGGRTLALEDRGELTVDPLPFRLFGIPDRIDEMPGGRLHLIDYKTGTPPSEEQQKKFDKQLLLAAAMAERGGFAALGPREVARITYLGMGAGNKKVQTDLTPALTGAVWEGLVRLITRYMARDQGYAARRAVFEDRFPGDYDHLARHGEWQMSDRAVPETVGPEDE